MRSNHNCKLKQLLTTTMKILLILRNIIFYCFGSWLRQLLRRKITSVLVSSPAQMPALTSCLPAGVSLTRCEKLLFFYSPVYVSYLFYLHVRQLAKKETLRKALHWLNFVKICHKTVINRPRLKFWFREFKWNRVVFT